MWRIQQRKIYHTLCLNINKYSAAFWQGLICNNSTFWHTVLPLSCCSCELCIESWEGESICNKTAAYNLVFHQHQHQYLCCSNTCLTLEYQRFFCFSKYLKCSHAFGHLQYKHIAFETLTFSVVSVFAICIRRGRVISCAWGLWEQWLTAKTRQSDYKGHLWRVRAYTAMHVLYLNNYAAILKTCKYWFSILMSVGKEATNKLPHN